MTSTPRLSVGLPVYNGETFVDQCVESILAQTFGDFELIICDNASTDGTIGRLEHWQAVDSRVRVHRASQNRGAAANFNWAFALSSAPYFKWCAVDDLMEPDLFRLCVEALDSVPEAALAYSGAVDIDETGQVLGEIYDNNADYAFESDDPVLRFKDLVCRIHSCIAVFGVIRRSVLLETSVIGPYAASDKVLLAEIGLKGRLVRVHDKLLLHRQHARRSVTENPTLRQRLQWFNPMHKGLAFPYFRLLGAYSRAAVKNNLRAKCRILCLVQVARWVYWRGWRGLVDDMFYYFRPAR